MKKDTLSAPHQASDKPKLPTPKQTRHSMAGKRHKQDMDRVHDDAHARQLPNSDQDDSFIVLKNDEEIPVKNPG